MAKYLKINSVKGKNIYIYDQRFQENTTGYNDLIYTDLRNNVEIKNVLLNGFDTKIFIKDIDFLPSSSSVFLRVKFNNSSYENSFGLVGYGSNSTLVNSWGYYIENERLKVFTSNELNYYIQSFENFIFNTSTVLPNIYHDLVFVQTNDSVKFYLDGELKDSMTLITPLSSTSLPERIYFGSLGEINSYTTIFGNIAELGIWKRVLNDIDIQELYKQDKIEDHPGLISTNKYIRIDAGKLYFEGIVHDIPAANIYITGIGAETIDLVIKERIITENEDIELSDTNVGTSNVGKPGAHRLCYEYEIVKDYQSEENDTNTIITLLKYVNGILVFDLLATQNKNPKEEEKEIYDPNDLDLSYLISSKLAEAIKDINGNFIVEGLDVNIDDKQESIDVIVSSGKYYINGVKKELKEDRIFNIDKDYQTYSITGEPIVFTNYQTPHVFYYQPLADNNSIKRVVMGIKKQKSLDLSGQMEDEIGENNIVKLHSVKIAGVEFYDIPDRKVELKGTKLNWLENPPISSTAIVAFTVFTNLQEGLLADYFRGIGNLYTSETVLFSGQNVNHILKNKPRYLIEVKSNDTIYVPEMTDTGFILKTSSGLTPNVSQLLVKYSYSTNSYYNNLYSLFFRDKGIDSIDPTVVGYVDYDYYLNEVYTIGITPDNTFKLYAGIPGSQLTMTKAPLSADVLPIADIEINPTGDIVNIKKYNWTRNPISNIVSTNSRLDRVENTLLYSELENKATSYADANSLKGTFVDPLTNYSKSDVYHSNYSSFINLINTDNACTSGLTKNIYKLQPISLNGFKKYKEIASINNNNTEVVMNREQCTRWIDVNTNNSTKIIPEVTIYNAFDYISERLTNTWLAKMIDNVLFNYQAIIPSNINSTYFSSLKISSDYTGSNQIDDRNHSSVIQKIVNNMESLLNITTEYQLNKKHLIFVGRGFSPLEDNIQIKINNEMIGSIIDVKPTFISNIQKFKIENVYTVGGNIDYYLNPSEMNSFDGWVASNTRIKANQFGEFIVKVALNDSDYLLHNTFYSKIKYTGLYETEFIRSNNENIKIKTNLFGLNNRLNNVVKHSKRINDSILSVGEYSNSTTPSVVQIFKVQNTITLDKISLFYDGDIASSLCIEIRTVENNSPSNVVLTREIIKNTTNKNLIVEFQNKILLENDKEYALCLCDNGNSKVAIAEIGQTTQLYNSLKGYSSVQANFIKTNLYDSSSKLMFNSNSSLNSNKYIVKNDGELAFNLYAINCIGLMQSSDSSYYSKISFNEIEEENTKYYFNFMCDFDDTYGDTTDVEFTYSYLKSENEEYSPEYKFSPYSLVHIPNGFIKIKFFTYIKTKNKNISPLVHLYPLLVVYDYSQESSYVSKSFNLYDNNADNVKIYMETLLPNDCNVSVKVSPDDSKTWREAILESNPSELVYTSDGRFVNYTFNHYFRLNKPSVSIKNNTNFGLLSGIQYYLISSVDKDGAEWGSNVISTNTLDNKQVELEITIDPNAYGFKVYRGTSQEVNKLKLIYDSTVSSVLSATLSSTGTELYLQSNTGSKLPAEGFIRVNNEIIFYGSRSSSGDVLTNLSRAQKDTVASTHNLGSTVYLWDFGTINSSKHDGQLPILTQDSKFSFTDGISVGSSPKYIETSNYYTAITNNTNIYPKTIKIRIDFLNNNKITAPCVKNLICNALI